MCVRPEVDLLLTGNDQDKPLTKDVHSISNCLFVAKLPGVIVKTALNRNHKAFDYIRYTVINDI